jgi:hypothetical protein
MKTRRSIAHPGAEAYNKSSLGFFTLGPGNNPKNKQFFNAIDKELFLSCIGFNYNELIQLIKAPFMLRFSTLICFILSTCFCFSQATFEKGYFIDRDDHRIECSIKVPEWNRTPTEFFYRLTDSSEIINAVPASVKEFGIGKEFRAISVLVNVDISSDDENNPSEMREPDWIEQQLFLMVLVDGEASLYQYDQPTIKRYFYKAGSIPVRQLVNKIYRLKEDNFDQIRTNAHFRQQLWTDVKVAGAEVKTVEKLEYQKGDLVKYFTDYDKQAGTPYTVQTRKKERAVFNLKITPGLNYSMFRINNYYYLDQVHNFQGQAGFRLGVESELIFPYTNKTVSLVLEPTYQYFNATEQFPGQEISVHINTIEFPVGVRYYVYFNKNLKGFINGFFIPGFGVKFNSDIKINDVSYGVASRRNFAAGIGISWKRLGLEFRWYSNKNVQYGSWYLITGYSRVACIVGYQLFRTK